MLHKLKGIVLHIVKHKDNTFILYLYTDKCGRKAYFFRRSKTKSNALQTLNLIDIEVYGKDTANMQYLREWATYCPLHNISTDVSRSAIAIFMGELLYKLLKEESPNPDLYFFLERSIQTLDKQEVGKANFHLYFMVQLSKYLGFSIPDNRENKTYFNIKTAEFTNQKPLHPLYFSKEESEVLSAISHSPVAKVMELGLSGNIRYRFLEKMIEFYNFHFDSILPIYSLSVLHEIFAD